MEELEKALRPGHPGKIFKLTNAALTSPAVSPAPVRPELVPARGGSASGGEGQTVPLAAAGMEQGVFPLTEKMRLERRQEVLHIVDALASRSSGARDAAREIIRSRILDLLERHRLDLGVQKRDFIRGFFLPKEGDTRSDIPLKDTVFSQARFLNAIRALEEIDQQMSDAEHDLGQSYDWMTMMVFDATARGIDLEEDPITGPIYETWLRNSSLFYSKLRPLSDDLVYLKETVMSLAKTQDSIPAGTRLRAQARMRLIGDAGSYVGRMESHYQRVRKAFRDTVPVPQPRFPSWRGVALGVVGASVFFGLGALAGSYLRSPAPVQEPPALELKAPQSPKAGVEEGRKASEGVALDGDEFGTGQRPTAAGPDRTATGRSRGLPTFQASPFPGAKVQASAKKPTTTATKPPFSNTEGSLPNKSPATAPAKSILPASPNDLLNTARRPSVSNNLLDISSLPSFSDAVKPAPVLRQGAAPVSLMNIDKNIIRINNNLTAGAEEAWKAKTARLSQIIGLVVTLIQRDDLTAARGFARAFEMAEPYFLQQGAEKLEEFAQDWSDLVYIVTQHEGSDPEQVIRWLNEQQPKQEEESDFGYKLMIANGVTKRLQASPAPISMNGFVLVVNSEIETLNRLSDEVKDASAEHGEQYLKEVVLRTAEVIEYPHNLAAGVEEAVTIHTEPIPAASPSPRLYGKNAEYRSIADTLTAAWRVSPGQPISDTAIHFLRYLAADDPVDLDAWRQGKPEPSTGVTLETKNGGESAARLLEMIARGELDLNQALDDLTRMWEWRYAARKDAGALGFIDGEIKPALSRARTREFKNVAGGDEKDQALAQKIADGLIQKNPDITGVDVLLALMRPDSTEYSEIIQEAFLVHGIALDSAVLHNAPRAKKIFGRVAATIDVMRITRAGGTGEGETVVEDLGLRAKLQGAFQKARDLLRDGSITMVTVSSLEDYKKGSHHAPLRIQGTARMSDEHITRLEKLTPAYIPATATYHLLRIRVPVKAGSGTVNVDALLILGLKPGEQYSAPAAGAEEKDRLLAEEIGRKLIRRNPDIAGTDMLLLFGGQETFYTKILREIFLEYGIVLDPDFLKSAPRAMKLLSLVAEALDRLPRYWSEPLILPPDRRPKEPFWFPASEGALLLRGLFSVGTQGGILHYAAPSGVAIVRKIPEEWEFRIEKDRILSRPSAFEAFNYRAPEEGQDIYLFHPDGSIELYEFSDRKGRTSESLLEKVKKAYKQGVSAYFLLPAGVEERLEPAVRDLLLKLEKEPGMHGQLELLNENLPKLDTTQQLAFLRALPFLKDRRKVLGWFGVIFTGGDWVSPLRNLLLDALLERGEFPDVAALTVLLRGLPWKESKMASQRIMGIVRQKSEADPRLGSDPRGAIVKSLVVTATLSAYYASVQDFLEQFHSAKPSLPRIELYTRLQMVHDRMANALLAFSFPPSIFVGSTEGIERGLSALYEAIVITQRGPTADEQKILQANMPNIYPQVGPWLTQWLSDWSGDRAVRLMEFDARIEMEQSYGDYLKLVHQPGDLGHHQEAQRLRKQKEDFIAERRQALGLSSAAGVEEIQVGSWDWGTADTAWIRWSPGGNWHWALRIPRQGLRIPADVFETKLMTTISLSADGKASVKLWIDKDKKGNTSFSVTVGDGSGPVVLRKGPFAETALMVGSKPSNDSLPPNLKFGASLLKVSADADNVSPNHVRLWHDPATNDLVITDVSRYGTYMDDFDVLRDSARQRAGITGPAPWEGRWKGRITPAGLRTAFIFAGYASPDLPKSANQAVREGYRKVLSRYFQETNPKEKHLLDMGSRALGDLPSIILGQTGEFDKLAGELDNDPQVSQKMLFVEMLASVLGLMGAMADTRDNISIQTVQMYLEMRWVPGEAAEFDEHLSQETQTDLIRRTLAALSPPAAGVEQTSEENMKRLGMQTAMGSLSFRWQQLDKTQGVLTFPQFVRKQVEGDLQVLFKAYGISASDVYRFIFGAENPPDPMAVVPVEPAAFLKWSLFLFMAMGEVVQENGAIPGGDQQLLDQLNSLLEMMKVPSTLTQQNALTMISRARAIIAPPPAAGAEEIKLRLFQPEDLPRIREIYRLAKEKRNMAPLAFPPEKEFSIQPMGDQKQVIYPGLTRWVVATDSHDSIVGFLWYSDIHDVGYTNFILEFGVDPAHEDQGVLEAMIESLKKGLHIYGSRRLRVHIPPEDKPLFDKLTFRQMRLIPNYYLESEKDAYEMEYWMPGLGGSSAWGNPLFRSDGVYQGTYADVRFVLTDLLRQGALREIRIGDEKIEAASIPATDVLIEVGSRLGKNTFKFEREGDLLKISPAAGAEEGSAVSVEVAEGMARVNDFLGRIGSDPSVLFGEGIHDLTESFGESPEIEAFRREGVRPLLLVLPGRLSLSAASLESPTLKLLVEPSYERALREQLSFALTSGMVEITSDPSAARFVVGGRDFVQTQKESRLVSREATFLQVDPSTVGSLTQDFLTMVAAYKPGAVLVVGTQAERADAVVLFQSA